MSVKGYKTSFSTSVQGREWTGGFCPASARVAQGLISRRGDCRMRAGGVEGRGWTRAEFPISANVAQGLFSRRGNCRMRACGVEGRRVTSGLAAVQRLRDVNLHGLRSRRGETPVFSAHRALIGQVTVGTCVFSRLVCRYTADGPTRLSPAGTSTPSLRFSSDHANRVNVAAQLVGTPLPCKPIRTTKNPLNSYSLPESDCLKRR